MFLAKEKTICSHTMFLRRSLTKPFKKQGKQHSQPSLSTEACDCKASYPHLGEVMAARVIESTER